MGYFYSVVRPDGYLAATLRSEPRGRHSGWSCCAPRSRSPSPGGSYAHGRRSHSCSRPALLSLHRGRSRLVAVDPPLHKRQSGAGRAAKVGSVGASKVGPRNVPFPSGPSVVSVARCSCQCCRACPRQDSQRVQECNRSSIYPAGLTPPSSGHAPASRVMSLMSNVRRFQPCPKTSSVQGTGNRQPSLPDQSSLGSTTRGSSRFRFETSA